MLSGNMKTKLYERFFCQEKEYSAAANFTKGLKGFYLK